MAAAHRRPGSALGVFESTDRRDQPGLAAERDPKTASRRIRLSAPRFYLGSCAEMAGSAAEMKPAVNLSMSLSRPSGSGATTRTMAVSDLLYLNESSTSQTFASYSEAIARCAVWYQ